MEKLILVTSLFFLTIVANAQNEKVEELITQGVALHDKGNYEEAIKKYDQALEIDSKSIYALGEKAYSLMTLKKYKEAISNCKKCIEINSSSEELKTVYTTYANSFDLSGKSKDAIKIYNEGIKKFPDYYHLYFNKGITLFQMKKHDEALICFEKSASLNPDHASSHNAIARTLMMDEKRIPALLVFCRFLVLEPQGNRAKLNLPYVQRIVKGNAEKTGKNSISINIDPSMISDSSSEKKANDFRTTDLILAMSSALDYDKKNKKKTEVELFIDKFETVCSMMEETKKDNFGFYWEYYAPYFIEMKEQNLIKPFAYIVYASSENKDVTKWLDANQEEIDKLYEWSSSYNWKN